MRMHNQQGAEQCELQFKFITMKTCYITPVHFIQTKGRPLSKDPIAAGLYLLSKQDF